MPASTVQQGGAGAGRPLVNRCSLTGGDGARDPISSIPVLLGYGKWTVNFAWPVRRHCDISDRPCGPGAGIHVLRDRRHRFVRPPLHCQRRRAAAPICDCRPKPMEETVPTYRAPVDEVMFLLTDVLKVARYDNLPGFADAPPDLVLAVLREAAKLCEEVTQPLNRSGDQEGCTRHHD